MHWIALRPTPDASHASLPDTYAALTWWALQFTPLVARVDDTLVLEISGSARLFGGLDALCAAICKPKHQIAHVQYAQGATSLVALGRLWAASAHAAPDALPVRALTAAHAHLPILARLGVTTWGELRALPRGGLVRRFGVTLVDALDRAYGEQPETYPWLTLPEVFDTSLELATAVETAPALLFGVRRLLAQLLVWLRARQHGALELELQWELDPRRSNAQQVDAHHQGNGLGCLVLRTAQATQDMQHLQRLLGEHLAQVKLPAPVLYLRLHTLHTQALAGETRSLLPDDVRLGDSLHQTLERMAARLGSKHILCAQAMADHRPECMQQWHPHTVITATMGAARNTSNKPLNAALYPTWLLATPRPVSMHQHRPYYQGELTLLSEPMRLESGWLQSPIAMRDYYVARSQHAGLVWIYCERSPNSMQWYLHGFFG